MHNTAQHRNVCSPRGKKTQIKLKNICFRFPDTPTLIRVKGKDRYENTIHVLQYFYTSGITSPQTSNVYIQFDNTLAVQTSVVMPRINNNFSMLPLQDCFAHT